MRSKNKAVQRCQTGGPAGARGGSSVTSASGRDLGETGSAGADAVIFCSSCGRQYRTVAIDEGVARAKLLW